MSIKSYRIIRGTKCRLRSIYIPQDIDDEIVAMAKVNDRAIAAQVLQMLRQSIGGSYARKKDTGSKSGG